MAERWQGYYARLRRGADLNYPALLLLLSMSYPYGLPQAYIRSGSNYCVPSRGTLMLPVFRVFFFFFYLLKTVNALQLDFFFFDPLLQRVVSCVIAAAIREPFFLFRETFVGIVSDVWVY